MFAESERPSTTAETQPGAQTGAGRGARLQPPSADGELDLPGIRLHYREWAGPSGGPERMPLLLLHGLASASRIWDAVAPLLARERRVVALDQRGHGRSEKPDSGYDFSTIVADDLAAADALGLGRQFAVAGHSWGANVAVEFAAAYPERIPALALVDGGWAMLRQRPGATWEQVSRDLAPPEFAGTPREQFLGWMRQSIPALRPELEESMLNIVELRADDTVAPRLSRAHHMQILRSMWDEEPESVFGRVRASVLYILAQPASAANENTEQDDFYRMKREGIEQARQMYLNAARVAVEWVPNAVHDIPLQYPDDLAARIARLLSEVAG